MNKGRQVRCVYRVSELAIILIITFAFIVIIPNVAIAQYHGSYSGKDSYGEKEKLEIIVPRVFSSQVSSVQQTEKLDEVYDGLYSALWNYAISDLNYQKQLYSLLENKRFRTTRYAAEFSGVLKSTLNNLNSNHKKMQKAIEEANLDFEYIRKHVSKEDQQKLDVLWTDKIDEYKKFANQYFKMEHQFLKTYRNLAAFILKQGGSYYYDRIARTVKFYKLGAYEFYGQLIDKLHIISYKQVSLLKSHVPANMDPDLLK